MNSISFFKALLMKEIDEELKGGQKKLDVAEPKGKITAADFKALRAKKGMKKEVDTPNPPTDYSGKPAIPGLGPIVGMKEDHEVSMAHNSLESIIKSAMELKMKLGNDERNIPGWIQDHITNAENYIDQAAQGFHELEGHDQESEMDELPVGNEEEPVDDMALQSIMEALFGEVSKDPYDKVKVMKVKDKFEAYTTQGGKIKTFDTEAEARKFADEKNKKKEIEEAKKKPSAGLSKKQKSTIAKKAASGKDIGKKGKGFEMIAKKAAKKYGSKERGQAVAAAAMWKSQAKKAK
jgi:hypothetical protein